MAEKQYDVVVIGAGPGGYAAAFRAADLGLQTALVDQDAQLGGVCLLRGCIPSKALLHAAKIITEAAESNEWGIHFEKPRLELEELRRKKNAVVGKLSTGVQTLAKSRNVDVFQARAALKNPTTLVLKGTGEERELKFKHAILATGSRPVIPGPLRLDDSRVMDSTGALNLPEIPKRMLVVGGGYIGMELGTVYDALGTEVTVVEGLPRLLNGADPDLVRPLQTRVNRRFKALRFNTMVEKLESRDEGVAATLKGPDGTTTEVFERVLIAVGRKPNSENLGLENTRIKPNAKGFIPVDKQMRTAEPTIFAIGDVVGDPMLAHKASHEGRVAAEVIAGKDSAMDVLVIPAVVFTDPEIAWCGLTEEQAKAEGKEIAVARFPWSASGRATTLARNDGLTKFILDPETGHVLGVGICGSGAGELISEGVLAVEMGAVAEDVASSIHPHPTLSETVMESAEAFFGSATHIFSPKRS
jgi:dihydrolipoamide dehydrogenase